MGCVEPAALVRETVLVPRKAPRPPGPDDWASERIRYERERRGWSTAELARRVSLAGVQMRQQQVWQVESGEPRRRLSVGEAAAFAKVLGISLAELMTPPEKIAELDLIEIGRAFAEWRRDAGVLAARLLDIAKRVDELGEDDIYTADNLQKWSGLGGASDQVIRDLEAITENNQVVMESVKTRGSVWSVIASMWEQVMPAEVQAQAVVAVIVTSARGVLIGRRNDGTPPWTFIAGEIEPGERPEDAAVREVKEETGVEIRAGEVIGERDHPATGRHMIYMAARPTRMTGLIVGDESELAEVRWASLAEADELLPGMFGPVREYLARELATEPGS